MSAHGVSPSRRRIGNTLAVLVVAILAVTVWQTWDHWRTLAGFPDARRTRDGRRFGPGPQGMRFPVYGEADPDAMDWELRDRVRTALEIEDNRAWAEIEPKVAAVVRLKARLPETPDLLQHPAPTRTPSADEIPVADDVPKVREERAQMRAQLKHAQDELRKSVTRRQEAALVLLGLLE